MKSLKIKLNQKKDVNKKQIGQYLRLWLGVGIVAAATPTNVIAGPGSPYATGINCFVGNLTNVPGTSLGRTLTINGATQNDNNFGIIAGTGTNVQGAVFNNSIAYSFRTFDTVVPTTASNTPITVADINDEPVSTLIAQQVFISIGAGLGDEVCTYEYTLQGVGTALTRTFGPNAIITRQPPAAIDPTAVPIFTPLGIFATVSGLIWFGRRRSIKLKNT